jgi:nitronate monooxygenase
MTGQNAISGWNHRPLSNRLGTEYPIIQGPLGGLPSQRLTAAVANFGGLGSFGARGLTPGAIKSQKRGTYAINEPTY